MGKGKSLSYPEKEKDGQLTKLKNANRRLKSENTRLLAEIKTYEAAFQKNITFLKGKTKDLTVQELIDGAKKEQNLGEIETTKEETYQEFKQKWKCFQCNVGVMKITMINRQDGRFYFRNCTNTEGKCKHRTELKPFTDDVEIS